MNLDNRKKEYAEKKKRKEDARAIRRLLEENHQLERNLEIALEIKRAAKTIEIKPRLSKHRSEATAVALASDWHVEEKVDPKKTNGVNAYNLDIAKARAEQFFQRLLRLIEKERQDVDINDLVLWLGGDFITGNIHAELPAVCLLPPIEAIGFVQGLIEGGINLILNHSKLNLLVVCNVGNHARITPKTHFTNEQGNSLEYFMYHALKMRFDGKPRVKFVIADGYHQLVKVYDQTLCFHHGHAVKFLGGIGGLTVPMLNKIAKWGSLPTKVDLYCSGHFHSLLDAGRFISNGSMIGYGSMGVLYGGFERPQQALFLIDKKRGKTISLPVLFDV